MPAPDTAQFEDTAPGGDAGVAPDAGPDVAESTSKGPAYVAGTAACSADDGTRRIKLVNNCEETRWFKLDGKTTPLWARPASCPWQGAACSDIYDVGQCTAIAEAAATVASAPGLVWCLPTGAAGEGACHCNPYFELGPGQAHEIVLADDVAFPSGTGWLAKGCNAYGSSCELGSVSAKNNIFWCGGAGCRFDVAAQCPDGSASFPSSPAGCTTCPTKTVDGKTVIDGGCGTCPDGSSSNAIPTGTILNLNNIGGAQWTWSGAPDFAHGWGYTQGASTDRRYTCTGPGPVCEPVADGAPANTCLGGCDLCTSSKGVSSIDEACIKYCCPDVVVTYDGFDFSSQPSVGAGLEGVFE